MLASQLQKIDDFYSSQQHPNQDQVITQPLNPNTTSLLPLNQPTNNKTSNIFKDEKSHHFTYQTVTKWDTFEPRAFNRLSNRHKDEHFLQLFEDYIEIKSRLNTQLNKNRSLSAGKTRLEGENALLKRKSPERQVKGKREEWNENQQLKEEVKRLHMKIVALTENKPKVAQLRPQSAAGKKQKVILPTTQDIKGELQFERKQVKELLLIIDQLKAAKYSLQTQLKERQSQAPTRPGKVSTLVGNVGNESQFQSLAFQLERWKQKYDDLQMLLGKISEEKERKIKQLEVQNLELKQNERSKSIGLNLNRVNQINSQFYQEKIETLERENQKLESQIRRLVQLPFNQNNDNKAQINLQNKNIQLQSALQKMKDQLNKVKENSNKYLADLEFKNRQGVLLKGENEKLKKQVKELIQKQTNSKGISLADSQIDYDDYYRKLLNIVHLDGDDPVWRKFAALATPNFDTMSDSQLKIQAKSLWKSKLQLLAHLEKAQVELKTLQQSTNLRVGLYLKDKQVLEEELRQARARLDEWSSMQRLNNRRQVQIYSWAGLRYDDSISVFEADESELKDLENDFNYFDLFLGQLGLDQTALSKNPSNRIKDISKMVSFLTVDFYNHDTQHSHFAEGNSRKLDNNFSFRVEMGQSLIKFLTRQSLTLQLWSPQGSTTVLLGKGEIWLRDLVTNASKEVSAVLRGKCPLYQQDKSLVATVEYRMRFRLPIGSICEWAKEQAKGAKPVSQLLRLAQRKRLQISIIKAYGLPTSVSCFVYFSLQGQDYFTEAIRGSTPEWNYKKQIEVMMSEELEEEIKQNYFQFTLFDDDKPVNQDVIGLAKADLTRMVDNLQKLQAELEIKNAQFQEIGRLKVHFRWV